MSDERRNQTAGPGTALKPGAVTAIDGERYLIDLHFQDEPQVIAAYLVRGRTGAILIETGPGSTFDALVAGIGAAGLSVNDLTAVYVTHIHLDHAGAAGLLAAINPRLTVHAHPFGVPHIVDPSKLIASAARIYGDQMDRLWGKWAPIDTDRVKPIEHGERIDLGGRVLTAWHTPGHARHHVAFLEDHNGDLYTGDVAGVQIPGAGYVLAPTPPPEFDPKSWADSIALMRSLQPLRLVPTHFGPVSKPGERLAALERSLARFVEIAEGSHGAGEDQVRLTERLHAEIEERIADTAPGLIDRLELASPSYMAAMGLTRYLTKRTEAAAAQGR
jgi:glyoxylase-like metal-dependent hydrolase (beta-lactamase superfamily II)